MLFGGLLCIVCYMGRREQEAYPMGRPRRKTALASDHTLQSSEIDTCLLESLLDLDIRAVFFDSVVLNVSQGLGLHAAQRY